jgi:hypothetical protein
MPRLAVKFDRGGGNLQLSGPLLRAKVDCSFGRGAASNQNIENNPMQSSQRPLARMH